MKTQSITPSFTGKFVIPNADSNKKVDYLYNKVSKIVKANQVTTEFHTDKIVISADKTQDNKIVSALKEFGIKFFPVVKK